ncbi:hypothetical protein, partial [Achromobacter sp. Bel]|uniref:hypothetical protein n=1 Tax=Achromobacter sp. Bel TaxID=2727415 RepID=UPI00145C874C
MSTAVNGSMRRRRAGTSGGTSIDCSAVARAGPSSPAGSPSVGNVAEGTKADMASGVGVGVGVGVFCTGRNAPIAAANA